MAQAEYRFANPADEGLITSLLSECDLPACEIAGHVSSFILAEIHQQVVGVVGLEACGDFGLLRSLAVGNQYRRQGIGASLLERIVSYAQYQRIKTVFLLTLNADGFFRRYGFVQVGREDVPQPIQKTAEFKHVCPASAICMSRRIDKGVRYYTKDVLRLREDVPGAKMWAVSLEKTMFTYFEVEPGSRFDTHSHESEQITMVLDGTLYFEVEGEILSVGPGEVVAIPSDVPHAVFTKEAAVKAVDAWSPVMQKY